MSAPATAPSGLRIALLLGTMTALTVIGSSAVAVALPQLADELGLTTGTSAWVIAAFALTFSLCTAVFGRLADLLGVRVPFVVGAGMLIAGSLLAAAAPNFGVLVAGRLVQGAGAGSIPVLGVAILQSLVPPHQRAGALGALTAVVTIVSGSGPLIGGALTQLAGWRAVVGVPALALVLVFPVARLCEAQPTAKGRLDTRGLALVAVAVVGLMLAMQGRNTGLGLAGVATFAASAALAAVLLAFHVRSRPAGFLPHAVVTNGRLIRAALAGSTLMAAYVSGLFSLPTVLTASSGWPPLAIGAVMLPAAALGAVGSRVAGVVAGRPSSRVVVVLAALGAATGLVVAGTGAPSPWFMVPGFGLVAAGFGATQVIMVDAVPRMVEPATRGAALGIFNLLFFGGSAVGAAALGGLVDAVGVPAALATMAVLPAVGAALAASVDTVAART